MSLSEIAQKFPDIERLTSPVHQLDRFGQRDGGESVLAALMQGPKILWPKLRSIAVPASRRRLDASALRNDIRELQGSHPMLANFCCLYPSPRA